MLPFYWAIAMKRLQGIQAAAGLAFINTIGLLGGFVGPYLFGMAETRLGAKRSGLYGGGCRGGVRAAFSAGACQGDSRGRKIVSTKAVAHRA